MISTHFDLITPDGKIIEIEKIHEREQRAVVSIENIAANFVGFDIEKDLVFFNLKSSLAQIGLHAETKGFTVDFGQKKAFVEILLRSYGPIARELLKELPVGAYIGKLFARDLRRRVRKPEYLTRMFGRSDRNGEPLLYLGETQGSDTMIFDQVDGRLIAYLSLKNGRVAYESSIFHFLSTMKKALVANISIRKLLEMHQIWNPGIARNVVEDEILLVQTAPLHIRTVFAYVANELLAPGFMHTSASILQPDTFASGNIYELFGCSKREITDIPIEFYTLEPYQEHVFFSDRDQLQAYLEDTELLFRIFDTAPNPNHIPACVFLVKGHQIEGLQVKDWICSGEKFEYVDKPHQAMHVSQFLEAQCSYPFLKAIDEDIITSQGVLFSRYFPSPMLKRMLLSENVSRCLKGIYFKYPSESYGDYFSCEDRALLNDLHKFSIPVFWVDEATRSVLQYIQKPLRAQGHFVPVEYIDTYLQATFFGVYGSNLVSGEFDELLSEILQGVLEMRQFVHHPLLNKTTPIAFLTGGGPGVMEVGNRIARKLGILSCANIADFRTKEGAVVNEQRQNPYIQAKMTYRHIELVERQAEFNLDFPIFVTGGIGTDFEFCLEEVRRKVGCVPATPILLLGDKEDWKKKITSRFGCNMKNGTIKGSEWVSNCFYHVQNAQEGIEIYRKFFSGILNIGKGGAIYSDGFASGLSE